ncbi:hypothetical protein D4S03_06400 [bacterium]|nr:MAG: hypothetical protein D4S03_06400 [bacterium]
MNCLKCGSTYLPKKQKLVISDKYVGPISIENASYYQCEKCDEKLLPVATARRIDKRRQEMFREYLQNQPISAFFSASEMASFLGISRQALHKHKRIRKGFIYNTFFENRVIYLRKSADLYKKTGDGRFDVSYSGATLNLKQSEWRTELQFKTPKLSFLFTSKVVSIDPTAYLNTLKSLYKVTLSSGSTLFPETNADYYIIAADDYDKDTISDISDRMDNSFQTVQ